jgi:predicted PurR-regulated permease PerM
VGILVWNTLAVGVITAAVIAVLLRPVRRWRLGVTGKVVSILGVITLYLVVAHALVPVGAIVVLLRHRDQSRPNGPGVVGMAEDWPGQARR